MPTIKANCSSVTICSKVASLLIELSGCLIIRPASYITHFLFYPSNFPMIGILKPEKMELLLKDCLYYKLYYCSICRHMVKTHNRLYAFVNTYEGTLIAMLYNEMVVQDIHAVKDRCSGMPIAKVPALPSDHAAVRLGALISLLAFQIKFQDNLDDEEGFWVTRYNRVLQSRFQKAFDDHFDQYQTFNIDIAQIQARQKTLTELEESSASFSDIQEYWGETFAYIMTQPFKEKVDRHSTLKNFFKLLGKVINLLDAMEDFHSDLKARRFNLIHHAEEASHPDDKTWLEKTCKKYSQLIASEKQELRACLPALNLNESFPVVENIITHCLDKETEKVFESMVNKKQNPERILFNCKDF